MQRKPILVVGGAGFVGRHVVGRLVECGFGVIVPTRRRGNARHLYTLPTVDIVEVDVNQGPLLRRLVRRAGAVINLVGILNETGRSTFAQAHAGLARELVAACAEAGVARLVQMSALNANPDGPSRYLRSKGEAEAAIVASSLAWTIVQPSVIFGREDRFLNLFAGLMRLAPVFPLARADARFQPIGVDDVAECIVRALSNDATIGHKYPLCGPTAYTLQDLVRYVGGLTGTPRVVIPLGRRLSALQARVLEVLPGALMSRDNLASMTIDSVCGCEFPAVFGLTPQSLEAVVPTYLGPAAAAGPYDVYRASGGR